MVKRALPVHSRALYKRSGPTGFCDCLKVSSRFTSFVQGLVRLLFCVMGFVIASLGFRVFLS